MTHRRCSLILVVSFLLLAAPAARATPTTDASPPAREPPRAAPEVRPPVVEPPVRPDPPAPARTPPPPPTKRRRFQLDLDLDGMYAAALTYLHNLAALKGSTLPNTTGGLYRERLTRTSYLTHQLRIEPEIRLGNLAIFRARLDGLQSVVWGDNDGRAQSPIFAANPTNTNDLGEPVSSIALTYAYLELDLKLGRLLVGRMPSNWGMGLLNNGGGDLRRDRGGVDDDFGDNRSPSVLDRLAFATKPVSIVKTLARSRNVESNLVFAYAYDRLVEEPYWRGVAAPLQRPYGEQGFLSRQLNNVDEHVFLLLYDDPRFLAGQPGLRRWQEKTLTAGAYFVYRRQDAEKGIVRVFDGTRYQAYDCADASPPPACGARSRVFIIDPYVKLRLGPLLVEAEGYVIFGSVEKGKGIPIGNEVGKVLLHGFAGRLGYRLPRGFEVLLDFGQAEGDASLPDETFRQKAFHPDYGVGLALYREFLRERTATALAQRLNATVASTLEPARGLQSNGGVINSVFLFPRVRWQVNRHVALKLALVAAWADVQDGEFLFRKGTCAKGDVRCRITDQYLGTEIDVGLDLAWGFRDGQPHLLFRFDMGYLVFGPQVSADYDAPGMFALRTRLMMVF